MAVSAEAKRSDAMRVRAGARGLSSSVAGAVVALSLILSGLAGAARAQENAEANAEENAEENAEANAEQTTQTAAQGTAASGDPEPQTTRVEISFEAASDTEDALEGADRFAVQEIEPPVDPTRAGGVIADPVAAARAYVETYCLKVGYPDDFSQFVDLTGDGIDDVIISFAVMCDGYHSVFCGVSGCDGRVFVALEDGGYQLTSLPPTVEAADWNGLVAVRVYSQERFCRGQARERCAQMKVWDGTDFVDPREAGRLQPAAPATIDPDEPAVSLSGNRSRWSFEAYPEGGGSAQILGADGAALVLDCRPGDDAIRLSFRPDSNGAAILPTGPGARVLIEFVVGRAWRFESRLMIYIDSERLWRDRVLANGTMIDSLRRGSAVRAREPGRRDPLGAFSLAGSASAISLLGAACGL